MNEYEKFLFDLNGYLVVEDILSAAQVAALNEALIHGALPWTGAYERRMLIMRYGPGIMSFSPPAAADANAEIAALAPLHQALLQPPGFPYRAAITTLLQEAPQVSN